MKTLIPSLLILLTIACSTPEAPDVHEIPAEAEKKEEVVEVRYPELQKQVLELDSLLFQVGFNTANGSVVGELIADDFEFYHDVHGLTDSKEEFVMSINQRSELPFKTWRTLIDSTTEVFPLYNGIGSELYGAIQTGSHVFYQQYDGEEAKQSGTARFTHLWIVEDSTWQLKRVLSYDHLE